MRDIPQKAIRALRNTFFQSVAHLMWVDPAEPNKFLPGKREYLCGRDADHVHDVGFMWTPRDEYPVCKRCRKCAEAELAGKPVRNDLAIVRRMLEERPQCATDYEADDAFAAEVGLLGLEHEERVHRRRVRALGQLVKLGEAEAWWIGIPLDSGWHGARRARMYGKAGDQGYAP